MGIRRCGDHGIKKFRSSWAPQDVSGIRAVPFKFIVTKDFDNVFLAGRCMSCDTKVVTCVRYMAVCMCTGQAAGAAAALCHEDNVESPSTSYCELRTILLDGGAIIQ